MLPCSCVCVEMDYYKRCLHCLLSYNGCAVCRERDRRSEVSMSSQLSTEEEPPRYVNMSLIIRPCPSLCPACLHPTFLHQTAMHTASVLVPYPEVYMCGLFFHIQTPNLFTCILSQKRHPNYRETQPLSLS